MSLGGGYVQRGWVCPGGGYVWKVGIQPPPPPYMGPGILWDAVNKWAVRILLECFLVSMFLFIYFYSCVSPFLYVCFNTIFISGILTSSVSLLSEFYFSDIERVRYGKYLLLYSAKFLNVKTDRTKWHLQPHEWFIVIRLTNRSASQKWRLEPVNG